MDILSLQDVPVLRLGVQNPVPDDTIKNFCNDLEKVIVVEEMEPYLENEIKRIAFDEDMRDEKDGKKICRNERNNL